MLTDNLGSIALYGSLAAVTGLVIYILSQLVCKFSPPFYRFRKANVVLLHQNSQLFDLCEPWQWNDSEPLHLFKTYDTK